MILPVWSSSSPPNTANFFKAEVKLEPSFNATADFHKSHIKRRRRLQNASGIKRYAWLFPAHQLSAKTYVQKERRSIFPPSGHFPRMNSPCAPIPNSQFGIQHSDFYKQPAKAEGGKQTRPSIFFPFLSGVFELLRNLCNMAVQKLERELIWGCYCGVKKSSLLSSSSQCIFV